MEVFLLKLHPNELCFVYISIKNFPNIYTNQHCLLKLKTIQLYIPEKQNAEQFYIAISSKITTKYHFNCSNKNFSISLATRFGETNKFHIVPKVVGNGNNIDDDYDNCLTNIYDSSQKMRCNPGHKFAKNPETFPVHKPKEWARSRNCKSNDLEMLNTLSQCISTLHGHDEMLDMPFLLQIATMNGAKI